MSDYVTSLRQAHFFSLRQLCQVRSPLIKKTRRRLCMHSSAAGWITATVCCTMSIDDSLLKKLQIAHNAAVNVVTHLTSVAPTSLSSCQSLNLVHTGDNHLQVPTWAGSCLSQLWWADSTFSLLCWQSMSHCSKNQDSACQIKLCGRWSSCVEQFASKPSLCIHFFVFCWETKDMFESPKLLQCESAKFWLDTSASCNNDWISFWVTHFAHSSPNFIGGGQIFPNLV